MAGITNHRELLAWQLASELRALILKLTSVPPACRDQRFRSQTEDAAASVCRNLTEGFYRFLPRETLTFVRYAEGSLREVGEQLDDGIARDYWGEDDERVEGARNLIKRAGKAIGRWRKYLRSRRARENAEKILNRFEQ